MSGGASTKVAFGAALVVGTATAAGLAYLYKQKCDNTPPTKWKRVGELVEINCYPIKSCGPVQPDEINCSLLGIVDGNLRDRVFMVVTPEGQFVTGRAHPKLVLIKPRVVGDKLILSAPESSTIEVDFNKLKKSVKETTYVWHQQVKTADAGDEVAQWLSRYILGADMGLRLVYYPESYPTRDVRPHVEKYKKVLQADSGALHDATAYMVINQGSIDDLNSHLDHVITPLQFRPNFVVKGPKAYEEDNWNWVKIGENVVFRSVKPCTRCIFTNINPKDAVRNSKREPLTYLKKTRSYLPGEPPVMGAHIGLRTPGKVTVGDAIYVEDRS